MAIQTINTREERGQAIAQSSGQVKHLDDCTYSVQSQSHKGTYTVKKNGDEWVCSCPDNTYRHLICKHIYAVDYSTQLRKAVASKPKTVVINELNAQVCKYCGSTNLKRDGIRHNKSGYGWRFRRNMEWWC